MQGGQNVKPSLALALHSICCAIYRRIGAEKRLGLSAMMGPCAKLLQRSLINDEVDAMPT